MADKIKVRVVKQGRAKDYKRNAKYFPYYYVCINKENVVLQLGGWDEGEPVIVNNGVHWIEYNGSLYQLKFQ